MLMQALGLNRYGLSVNPGSPGFLSSIIGSVGQGLGYGIGAGWNPFGGGKKPQDFNAPNPGWT
jgi:hypothetical protein